MLFHCLWETLTFYQNSEILKSPPLTSQLQKKNTSEYKINLKMDILKFKSAQQYTIRSFFGNNFEEICTVDLEYSWNRIRLLESLRYSNILYLFQLIRRIPTALWSLSRENSSWDSRTQCLFYCSLPWLEISLILSKCSWILFM